MFMNNEQEQEIKSIKERNITIKLSDADADKLSKKAKEFCSTVPQLLENIIEGLIDGTYLNGSMERLTDYDYDGNALPKDCGVDDEMICTRLAAYEDAEITPDDILSIVIEREKYKNFFEEIKKMVVDGAIPNQPVQQLLQCSAHMQSH